MQTAFNAECTNPASVPTNFFIAFIYFCNIFTAWQAKGRLKSFQTASDTENTNIRNNMPAADTRTPVEVAAGILTNTRGEYLLSSRPEGKPYASYWEFAGGKTEAGETPFAALQREFAEELGITITRALPWLVKTHSYEHARVRLRFFRIPADGWTGSIQAREGQSWAWQKPGAFTVSPMLPANGPLLKALSVPTALTGRLKNGFHGANGAGAYRAVPLSRATPDDQNLLLTQAEYRARRYNLPPAASLWLAVENAQEAEQAQETADVIVWRVTDGQAAQNVSAVLQNGVSAPLVVSATPALAAQYAAAWTEAGAQAVAGGESDTGH